MSGVISKRRIIADILKIDQDELEYLGEGAYATVFAYKGKAYKLTEDEHDFKVCTKLRNTKKVYKRLVKIYDTKIVNVSCYGSERTYYLIVAELAQCIYHTSDTLSNSLSSECAPIRRKLNEYEIFKRFQKGETLDSILNNIERFSIKNKDFLLEECIRIVADLHSLGVNTWDFHNENISLKDGRIVAIDLGHLTGFDIRVSKRRKVILKY